MIPIGKDGYAREPFSPKEQKRKSTTDNPKMTELSKKIPRKAKEAEDLRGPAKAFRRDLSTHPIKPNVATEKEEIAKRSGGMWECVGRKPDKMGGYIYIFKLRKEYDDVTPGENLEDRRKAADSKYYSMYPALEAKASQLFFLYPESDREQGLKNFIDEQVELFVNEKIKSIPLFLLLMLDKETMKDELKSQIYSDKDTLSVFEKGYEDLIFIQQFGYKLEHKKEGVFLELPDKESLINRWEKHRETHPHLPPLDIITSEGIAKDLDYIEAYFTHDALLSSGKEFVHDHLSHITKLLLFLISSTNENSSTYRSERTQLVKHIAASYRTIMIAKGEIEKGKFILPDYDRGKMMEQIEKMEAALSAFVDTLSAVPSMKTANLLITKQSDWMSGQAWNTPYWNTYFENRFQNLDGLVQFWSKCEETKEQLDALRHKEKGIT